VAAPQLDLPCDRPVTYPGDIKILIKSSNGRSGGGTNYILRIKEQETRLNLLEHDDDDKIASHYLTLSTLTSFYIIHKIWFLSNRAKSVTICKRCLGQ